MSHPTESRLFRRQPFQAECTQTHDNKTKTQNLTFTETQNTKNELNLKLKELHYTRA